MHGFAEKAAADTKDVGDRVRALFPNPSPVVHELMATAAGTSFEGGIYLRACFALSDCDRVLIFEQRGPPLFLELERR